LAVQERDLEVAGAGKMFSKQVSSVAKRDCHNEWLAHLRGGDVLMVAKPDRRARSTAELLEMEADLAKRDVRTDHSLHGRERPDTRTRPASWCCPSWLESRPAA
jgi:DNA invertase Pin-like site-specific DNA recombinase